MTHLQTLIEAIIVLVILIGAVLWLRRRGVVNDGHRDLFNRLVTEFALPGLIIVNLAQPPGLGMRHLPGAGLMFLSILLVGGVAWAVGSLMRLSRPVLGAVVMVSAFGSSSTLGYAFVKQVFPDDPQALTDALVIGEIGAIIPVFTVGVLASSYFGGGDQLKAQGVSPTRAFFMSPMFIALVIGLAISWSGLPTENWIGRVLTQPLQIAGDSLMILVAFSIGLMLRPVSVRLLLPLLLLVGCLKLILEPAAAGFVAGAFHLQEMERAVLVLEAAMPSGAIAAVVAARYGCDGAVASNLVIATYVLSLVTIPLIFMLNF
ncbi:MAG: AEC family transporter [Alphaproteobacteria bacterium]